VLFVSAHTGAGLDRLTQTVLRELDSHSLIVRVQVPLADGRSAALVRASGAITSEELIGEEALRFEIKLSAGALGNLRRGLAPDVQVQVHSMGRAVSESERALAELRKSW
jgi:50S ribosomal subunit-associated GTPase HflX